MSIYALVSDSAGNIDVRYNRPTKPARAPDGMRWIDDILPDYNTATHRLEEATPIAIDATQVPYNIVLRDLDAEAAAAQQNADMNDVEASAKDTAVFVLVQLVTKLLANGTIVTGDFSPSVEEAYQELKTKVDRLT